MGSFLQKIGRLPSQEKPVSAPQLKKQGKSRRLKAPVTAPPPPPPPPPKSTDSKKKRKKPIPAALREQVWLKQMGRVFEGKCPTTWCQNNITVYDFQSGHNIPESKGGPTTLENLIPICSRCNLSMGNEYTFDEWCKVFEEGAKPVVPDPPVKKRSRILCFW